jgi:pimeloyl-ACP methyl ester carboxylesterase
VIRMKLLTLGFIVAATASTAACQDVEETPSATPTAAATAGVMASATPSGALATAALPTPSLSPSDTPFPTATPGALPSPSPMPTATLLPPTITPTPGEFPGLVDVGGFELLLGCEGRGSPTVIFESNLSQSSEIWSAIRSQVAAYTHACSYNRAGIAPSDPAHAEIRTSLDAANELKTMLVEAGIVGPYVFVGDGFGAHVILAYANQHPGEIAGVVLVNPWHPDAAARYDELLAGGFAYGSEPIEPEMIDLSANQQQMSALGGAGSLGDIPLTIVSQAGALPLPGMSEDVARQLGQAFEELQGELVNLSTSAKQVNIESGESPLVDDPDLILPLIREVVEVVRSG